MTVETGPDVHSPVSESHCCPSAHFGRAFASRALRHEPTARVAVEAMLRGNADMYADPDNPSGCMVVLGATNWTPLNEDVRKFLAL